MRLGLVLAAVAALQQPASDRDELRRLQKEALAAHQRKDVTAFLELSRALQQKLPRSNRALYNLACAQALVGNTAEAVSVLDRLAARGAAYDVAADADFASMRTEPGFVAAAARMKALDDPVGSGTPAFTLADKTLITEGLAHDPKSGDFFVSSVHRRKIVRVTKDGRASDFTASAQHGLFSVIGLAVDARRNGLWAASQASKNMADFKGEKGSFVAEFDLATGALRRKLGPPAAVPDATLSDIAVGPSGELAVADPASGRVYLLPTGASELQVLIDRGAIDSAQGMAFTPDGRFLFVADYGQGVVKVDVQARSARLIDSAVDAALTGIDGLVWADGSLVGIQNGIRPHRVVRLKLDDRLERIEEVTVLERRNPHFDEPTLGVRVGADLYYVANSQYEAIREDGSLILERLRPPVVLRTRLPWLKR
jgi:sugar lactone lactonase YvrE